MKGRRNKIKETISSVFLREGTFKIGSPTLLKIVQQNGFSDCSEKEFLSIVDEMEKTKAICTKEEFSVDETSVGQLNFSIYPL